MPLPPPRIIQFPVSGLHENTGYDVQPEGTTTDMFNVRAHDALKGRMRGGRRSGLSKFHTSQINSSNAIQSMLKVVRPFTHQLVTDKFHAAAENAGGGNDGIFTVSDLGVESFALSTGSAGTRDVAFDGVNYYFAGESITISGYDSGDPNTVFKVTNDTAMSSGNPPAWSWDSGNSTGTRTAYTCVFDTANNRLYVGATRSTDWEGAGSAASLWALDGATGAVLWDTDLGSEVRSIDYCPALGIIVALVGIPNSSWVGAGGTTANLFTVTGATGAVVDTYNTGYDRPATNPAPINAGRVKIRSDGQVIVATPQSDTDWDGNDGTARNVFILNSSLTLVSSFLKTAGVVHDRVDVAWAGTAGDWVFYFGDDSNTAASTVYRYDSSGVEQWSFVVGAATASFALGGFDNLAIVGDENNDWDGATGNADYWVLNVNTGALILSDSLTAGNVHCTSLRSNAGSSEVLATREASLVIAAGGTIKKLVNVTLSTPTNGSSAMSDQPYRINMAQLFANVYMVDGADSKFFDLVADEVKDWATEVTSSGAGSLPTLCRLIARYRGRIVLSGKVTDPGNWFMSKVGDALDWDFAPATTTAIQAVAGNAAEVGLIGDVVTSLMPFNDDAMLIGGDQTIWQMSGDPAAGGYIDLVTDKIGVAWNAWTQGIAGEIYFLGTDGVYVVTPGELPTKLTAGRLDEKFKQLDIGNIRAFLAWDFVQHGLVVLLAEPGVTNQTIYFWDARANAWSEEQMPSTIGPSFLYAYDSERAEDTNLLIGSKDGYIRKVNPTATDDDGTAITSRVRYEPVPLTDGHSEGILQAIECTLATNSADVTMKVYTGQTAEQVATATTPRFVRTLTAGRNSIAGQRIRGRWIQIELGATTGGPWAPEQMVINVQPTGNVGRHKR